MKTKRKILAIALAVCIVLGLMPISALAAGLPTVTTDSASATGATTASVSGTVTDNGGQAITAKGFVFGTSANPTTGSGATGTSRYLGTTGDGLGQFTTTLEGLNPGTTYHVRAFAHNTSSFTDYVYGADMTFTTSASAYSWHDLTVNIPMDGISGLNILDMSFINASEGWLIAHCLDTASNTLQGRVFRTTDGGARFTSIYSFVSGSEPNAIDMISSTEGWIGSQNGRIYYTSDGGTSWTSLGSTMNAVFDIDVPAGSHTGYSVGINGTCYRFTTSGITKVWTYPLEERNIYDSINGVFFLNDNEGWYASNELIGHYTGGQWVYDQTHQTRPWTGIYMTSPTTGCVVGSDNEGVIGKTSDGINWGGVTNPDVYANYRPGSRGLFDINLLDTNSGWVVGGFGAILSTLDGGATWSLQGNGLTSSSLYSVYFSSLTNGYAAGATAFLKFTSTGSTAAEPAVTTGAVTSITASGASLAGNVTADGGATVTERGFVYSAAADPAIGSSGVSKVTASGTGTGGFSAVLSDLAASTPYHVRAYATNSKGTSYGTDVSFATLTAASNVWTDISDRVDTSGTVGPNIVFSDVKAVTTGGETRILISASNPKKVYRSADGCATIQFADTINANQAVYLLPDGKNAWTVGLGFGNKTTDGGASWTKITVGGTLYDVYFVNANVGYAVGNAGAVYRTTNGGATNADWKKMTVPLNASVLSVCAPDSSAPDTVYIAIANTGSTVAKSTNGGVSWTYEILSGITYNMNSLYFKDPSTAWAAGGNGEIFKYNGTAWVKQTTPVTASLNAITFAPDGLTGWAAGDNGVILHTADGGANWTQEASGTTQNLTGVAVVSATEAYAVGYGKTLLKFTATVSFEDVAADAWYSKAVSYIAARGITTGTTATTFSPDAALTRGQLVVLLMRTYGIAPDTSPTNNFSDAGNTYYTGYLAAAKRLGIALGFGDNKFAPEQSITRQEMFTLLYRALDVLGQLPDGHSGKTLSDFTDAWQIAPWAKDAMKLLTETGTISGSYGMLNPAGSTTRAEMAQVLYNLLTR